MIVTAAGGLGVRVAAHNLDLGRFAGLLRAESKFRRLKGHRSMPTLLKALEDAVRGEATGTERAIA
jgi:hypothetical protein